MKVADAHATLLNGVLFVCVPLSHVRILVRVAMHAYDGAMVPETSLWIPPHCDPGHAGYTVITPDVPVDSPDSWMVPRHLYHYYIIIGDLLVYQ